MKFDPSKYQAFIQSKVPPFERSGWTIAQTDVNPALKPHQRAAVQWMISGGRRALFAAFGLGKSVIQLEAVRLTLEASGLSRGLIVCPLGVRQEFQRDAVRVLGWQKAPRFIRRIEEADAPGVYLTNYETIRDGKMDPRSFNVASLDEASCLRGFGGTKTFREFMRTFAGDGKTMNARTRSDAVPYRFVATATPAPNEYIELLCYAAFLGIMDVSAAKTRFFKRDSTKADNLTIHPHKEREFWLWVSSWALFIQKPSNLGFPDDGYSLPALDVRWHEVATDHSRAGSDRDGQMRLLRNAAIGVSDASREKRDSLQVRIDKMLEIRSDDPAAHRVIWHDLEVERDAIDAALPGVVTVRGADTDEHKETSILGFADGTIEEIAGKPCMLGSGVNWQRHCHWAIYLGIGFKFNDFIQSVHRLYRFLQTNQVRIDLIYTEAEREIRKVLEGKWQRHKEMVEKMELIIKEYGLSEAAMASAMHRGMGMQRVEARGKLYSCVNADCIPEVASMPDNSVDLIVTSIPFSTQYEYSPNYADFGHSDTNDHFFKQMDFLTPEMLRALRPGRVACIHVKDRVVPGGLKGLSFQTVYRFADKTCDHFEKHGWHFMGRITIVTDVVRENNQTYRLGWTEQCKDGTKMGVGMPEYLLIFRKAPTGTDNSYADMPVVKSKRDYSRGRWQIDAHAFHRSDGNRLLTPEDLEGLSHAEMYRLFRDWNLAHVYDFEGHVRLCEDLDRRGQLPSGFMLLQPPSHSPEVWTDVARMVTLNSKQAAKGEQMHLCPLQFDIVDRCIARWSMPGETVMDPFGGIMTVPYRAILSGRKGIGIELNSQYWADGTGYCEAAESEALTPSLFDLEAV